MRQRIDESYEDFRKRDNVAKTKWRNKNRDKFKAYNRARRAKNPALWRAKHKKWRDKNREHVNACSRKRNVTEERRTYMRKYRAMKYATDPVERQKVLKRAKQYRESGRMRQRHIERYVNDPVYNLAIRIRNRIRMAFYKARLGTRKPETTIKLLGCSYAEFKQHIESQFTEGMTWQGVIDATIHIDHIKPVSGFDLTKPSQQKIAFNFQNCRPMWAAENISKGTKSDEEYKAYRNIIPFPKAA